MYPADNRVKGEHMNTEPLMAGTHYTVSEWKARRAAREKRDAKLEPYFEVIDGFLQLVFLVGLLWGIAGLIKFFWMHS
jgi:hypothetical protein